MADNSRLAKTTMTINCKLKNSPLDAHDTRDGVKYILSPPTIFPADWNRRLSEEQVLPSRVNLTWNAAACSPRPFIPIVLLKAVYTLSINNRGGPQGFGTWVLTTERSVLSPSTKEYRALGTCTGMPHFFGMLLPEPSAKWESSVRDHQSSQQGSVRVCADFACLGIPKRLNLSLRLQYFDGSTPFMDRRSKVKLELSL